jgi:ribosomal protein L37AE/L43A
MFDDFDEIEEPDFDPEECEECGVPAGDFGKEDFVNGAWRCPECGAVQ